MESGNLTQTWPEFLCLGVEISPNSLEGPVWVPEQHPKPYSVWVHQDLNRITANTSAMNDI